MNILTHLQELDDLIVKHTQPPVTTILRNKLAFAIEQAQAHSAAVERQEKTLATQIETIERLMKQNQELVAKYEHPDGDRCPFCHALAGRLKRINPHPALGPAGLNVGYYKCQHCGKDYDKNLAGPRSISN